MSVISKKFADELSADKPMRDAYLEEKTRAKLSAQIKANRVVRGLSQADLGQRMGKTQSNIHRLEDQNVARYTLTTLFQFASEYDCGVVVELVPYKEFLQRTADLSPSRLQVPSFTPSSLVSLWNSDDVPEITEISAQVTSQQIEKPTTALIEQSYSLLLRWAQTIRNTTKTAFSNFGDNLELSAQNALGAKPLRSPVISLPIDQGIGQNQVEINGIVA
jgi:transcriptional regulator with XRE-family HTH domain